MNAESPVILCVDDQEANLKLLENILAPRGYTVVAVGSGKEALLKIRSLTIDLVLLDVTMPGMTGFEVCREIKDDKDLRSIPVIMVTALTAKQDRIRGIESGAEDFLSKPFDKTEALARIAILLKVKKLSDERKRAEEALQKSHDELDARVQERTAELARANATLQADIAERKASEERILRQLRNLTAMGEIDLAISSSFDLRVSLSLLLVHVTAQLGVDAADVLLFNSGSQALEFGSGRGFRSKGIESTRQRMGEGYSGQAALERRVVHIADLAKEHDGFLRGAVLEGEAFHSYFGVPLIAKGEVKGVLEIFHRAPLEPDAEWLDFLSALAGQAAIAIDNVTLFESLQRSNSELTAAYDATIEGWSRALDLRDKETEGHTQRVTDMTLRLARILGLTEAELLQVRWGALLHDMGKMGVPDSILLKPGPLTEAEWVVMKLHPKFAYDLLSPIRHLRGALDIPYRHHEKWDGTGYTLGLKGEQIPLPVRIFSLADVWDALRSDRPYRAGWPVEKVRAHIGSLAGTHFDPQVVEAFLKADLT